MRTPSNHGCKPRTAVRWQRVRESQGIIWKQSLRQQPTHIQKSWYLPCKSQAGINSPHVLYWRLRTRPNPVVDQKGVVRKIAVDQIHMIVYPDRPKAVTQKKKYISRVRTNLGAGFKKAWENKLILLGRFIITAYVLYFLNIAYINVCQGIGGNKKYSSRKVTKIDPQNWWPWLHASMAVKSLYIWFDLDEKLFPRGVRFRKNMRGHPRTSGFPCTQMDE